MKLWRTKTIPTVDKRQGRPTPIITTRLAPAISLKASRIADIERRVAKQERKDRIVKTFAAKHAAEVMAEFDRRH